jgi:hypothetical protein
MNGWRCVVWGLALAGLGPMGWGSADEPPPAESIEAAEPEGVTVAAALEALRTAAAAATAQANLVDTAGLSGQLFRTALERFDERAADLQAALALERSFSLDEILEITRAAAAAKQSGARYARAVPALAAALEDIGSVSRYLERELAMQPIRRQFPAALTPAQVLQLSEIKNRAEDLAEALDVVSAEAQAREDFAVVDDVAALKEPLGQLERLSDSVEGYLIALSWMASSAAEGQAYGAQLAPEYRESWSRVAGRLAKWDGLCRALAARIPLEGWWNCVSTEALPDLGAGNDPAGGDGAPAAPEEEAPEEARW